MLSNAQDASFSNRRVFKRLQQINHFFENILTIKFCNNSNRLFEHNARDGTHFDSIYKLVSGFVVLRIFNSVVNQCVCVEYASHSMASLHALSRTRLGTPPPKFSTKLYRHSSFVFSKEAALVVAYRLSNAKAFRYLHTL